MDAWDIHTYYDGNKGVGEHGGFTKYVLYLIGIYRHCI